MGIKIREIKEFIYLFMCFGLFFRCILSIILRVRGVRRVIKRMVIFYVF